MKKSGQIILLYALGLIVAYPMAGPGQSTDWLHNKASRLRQAKEWLDEFESLNSQIPTLSPSEEEWLKAEIDETIKAASGHYTKRALSAMESREYQIRIAKRGIVLITNSLNNIILLCALSQINRDDKQEAKYWVRLSTEFLDYDLWQALDDLNKRDIIDPKTIFKGLPASNLESVCANWLTWSQQILNAIVMEYVVSDSLPP